MERFTRDSLRRILEIETWPCVTMYLPTGQSGPAIKQGLIRLKNLLSRAEKTLIQRGIRAQEARKVIQPALALLDAPAFWNDGSAGLAMVLTTEGMQTWRVPLPMPEMLVVSRRVCVKPLLPLVTDNQPFFLLAASQKGARLLTGDRWGLVPLEVDAMPAGLRDALNGEPPRAALQIASGGRGKPMIYGAVGETDTHKEELLTWFRMIDRALHDFLREGRAPLLFAGVEYLFPIFDKACTYPHLFSTAVHGNPDHLSLQALHRRATDLLTPQWQNAMQQDRDRFVRHMGTRLVSASVEDVVRAAFEGRIEALFVDRDHALWGRLDPETGKVDLTTDALNGSEDLLDRAAFETLAHRGRVYAVAGSEVPGGIALAAQFRYEEPEVPVTQVVGAFA